MSAPESSVIYKAYHQAGQLATEAYEHILSLIANGTSLRELCEAGDTYINVRGTGEMNGGVCHPTTVQMDNVVCNNAPMDSVRITTDSQIVKVQVGAHVNGFGAVVGGNFLLDGASKTAENLSRQAVATIKLVMDNIKPGASNHDLVIIVREHLKNTGFRGVPGLPGHSHAQFDIQGPKIIELFPKDESDTGSLFEEGEVYTAEVWLTNAETPDAYSSPDSEPTLKQIPPSVDVRNAPARAKEAYAAVTAIVGTFPFHVRKVTGLESEMAILHDERILQTYAPHSVQNGALVAQSVVSFIVTAGGAQMLSPKLFKE